MAEYIMNKFDYNNNTYILEDSNAIPKDIGGNTQNLKRPLQLNGIEDVTLDNKISSARANRLAFLPADQIIIEKTTDGGTTWQDAEISDEDKTALFSEIRPSIFLPLRDGVKDIRCGLRITFTAMKYNVPAGTSEINKYDYWNSNYLKTPERYCYLKEFYFWLNTNNDTISVKVERATGKSSTNWITIFENSNYGMSGYSGSSYVRFLSSTFGGKATQTTNYWNYRLTFFTRGPGGSTTLSGKTTTTALILHEIRGYGNYWWTAGNNYMVNDHLYSFDYLKNATFPGTITATQFLGDRNLLRWQNTTLSPQNIYDFGVFVGQGDNGIVGPSGSHFYIMLNLPYTVSTRDASHWAMSIAGSSSNDNRLFFRTSNATEWQGWQQVAHINANTTVGSETQPVYVSTDGFLTTGIDYKDFTIDIRQGKGTPITSGSNLDTDYSDPGTYRSGSSPISQSLTGIGSPITGSGFKLFTIGGYSDIQATQILIGNTKTDFFLRGRNNDNAGWSNWHKLVTISANDSDKKTFTITDNAISRFDGTTGKIQNSTATIDDNGNLSLLGTLYLNRGTSASYGRISYYRPAFKSWFTYMSDSAAGTAPTGGQPSTLGNVTSYALRHLIEPNSGYGWVWETAANAAAASTTTKPTPRMALSATTGQLWIASNAASDTVGSSGLIVDTSVNGSKGTAAIELYRGDPNGSTAASCSWQIANILGKLHFKDNWTSSALTTYQNDQLILNYNTGNVEIVKGNLYLNTVNRGIYFKDKNNTTFPAMRYNGLNLWIGATAGDGIHFVGQTYISSGYKDDGITGNLSAIVAIPTKNGSTVSYQARYLSYIDTSVGENDFTNLLMYSTGKVGITPFTTVKRTFASSNGSTPAHDNILFDQEGGVIFKTTRKSGSSGGWAVAPIRFINGKDATGQNENNDPYFYMGAYGAGFTLRYAFLGPQSFEGTKNLRIYPDGKVTSLSFETPTANIGTLNVEDSFYADDVNAGNLMVNGSGTFVQKVTASQYTGSGVLETQLTSNTSDDNKLPTASAIKNSLGYVTPQMFGAKADAAGGNPNPTDDTNAIQQALNSSLNVFFPPGTYAISGTLNIHHKAHIWGISGQTKIRALDNFNGEYLAQVAEYDANDKPNRSSFTIEKIQFDCNDVAIGGLYLARPYNQCTLRDVLINNCFKKALCVGDTRLITRTEQDPATGHDIQITTYFLTSGESRSQTLVIDNCMFIGSSSIAQTMPLVYIYNSFELNLKDSKFLFIKSNKSRYPCLELDFCYNTYVRGCSFLATFSEAVYITRNCRYFRLIGNTYENIADRTKAYATHEQTTRGADWLSSTDGGSAFTPVANTVYQLANGPGNYNIGDKYMWNGSSYIKLSDSDYRDCAIYCNGISLYDIGGPIIQGFIFETTYYNVSRTVLLQNTQYMTIFGSFRQIQALSSTNITQYNIFNGGTLATKEDITTQVDQINQGLPTWIEYSINTNTNSNVSPWGAMNSTKSIKSDIDKYGNPTGIVVSGSANNNPASAMMVGNNLVVYSRTAVNGLTVRVLFGGVRGLGN